MIYRYYNMPKYQFKIKYHWIIQSAHYCSSIKSHRNQMKSSQYKIYEINLFHFQNYPTIQTIFYNKILYIFFLLAYKFVECISCRKDEISMFNITFFSIENQISIVKRKIQYPVAHIDAFQYMIWIVWFLLGNITAQFDSQMKNKIQWIKTLEHMYIYIYTSIKPYRPY